MAFDAVIFHYYINYYFIIKKNYKSIGDRNGVKGD